MFECLYDGTIGHCNRRNHYIPSIARRRIMFSFFSFEISDAVFSPTHFVELSRMVFENDEQKINVAKEIANTCSTIRDQER